MQSDQPPSPTKPTPPKSNALRYALSLLLLVVVIGAIAWVAQYLPSLSKTKAPKLDPIPTVKLLEFPRFIAQWDNQKSADKSDDPLAKQSFPSKEFEFGKEGHYDFPFKNVSGKDIEVLHYVSDCDCTSIRVCAVPMEQYTQLAAQLKQKPGDPLTYATEPAWMELQNERQQTAEPQKKTMLTVKADEGGVVRVRWTVKKTPGQELRLSPSIIFRAAGTPSLYRQLLGVPVVVGTSVRFTPPRVDVGLLKQGGKPALAEFDAWSSTRKQFGLKLSALPASPFFQIETRPLTAAECAALESKVQAPDKTPAHVLSGHRVTVTVFEARDGKQLDQGPFYQKLAIELDGFPERELPGPEVVGRVQGDIRVGGDDDHGKIIFKTFRAGDEAYKSVELLAAAKLTLEPYTKEPSWLDVKVTRNKEQPDPHKHRWTLRVTVPAGVPGVRSFDDTDHVTLRIVGPPERFVRIAIEGHVSGR